MQGHGFTASECDCGKGSTALEGGTLTVDAGMDGVPMHYRELNCIIRQAIEGKVKRIILKNVTGQRYIAATASRPDLYIGIHGTPGNNLGAFLDGPTLEVFGNAQDMTGNTMNSGKMVVHGNAWDVTGLSARGGKMFIKGSSGYRVGIHMKEYGDHWPSLVIGGTAKDYLGEYMAGGTLVVLGIGCKAASPVGVSLGAGIHGGKMFIRGKVRPDQLGPGAGIVDMGDDDRSELEELLQEFQAHFGPVPDLDLAHFTKVAPLSSRPFSGKYDKTNL